MCDLKTNSDLFDAVMKPSDSENVRILRDLILSKISILPSQRNIELLEGKLKSFCAHLKNKWIESGYSKNKFLKRNDGWLSQDFQYPEDFFSSLQQENEQPKPFSECSDRHKMRRVEELRRNYSGDELLFAAKMNLFQEGYKIKAKIIDKLLKHPEDSEEIKKMCDYDDKKLETSMLSNERTLAPITALNLSKSQYRFLREVVSEGGIHNMFPSYFQIAKAKKECYPEANSIEVTEKEAKVSLQALLDHTVSKLLMTPSVKEHMSNGQNLTLISKWGLDGSSSQSVYKQTFSSNCDQDVDDSSLYLTTLVPMKMIDQSDSSVIWENARPSSIHFCRPLRFMFCKETPEVIKTECERMESDITLLRPTYIDAFVINHQLHMTMIDGKTINVLTETRSSMPCYICGATPIQMNDLERVALRIPNEDYYKFGISSLHAKIRFFECLLHLSYNLDFKKWSASTKNYKDQQQEKKKEIQRKFQAELGLPVDRVKQGVGTFNDGNMARKFFQDPERTAKIIGLEEEVIRRFAVVLQAISSGQEICPKKFVSYAKETAEIFVKHYGWYYMPPTVHKVLIHGEKIIENFIIPLGKFSGEAQEALNKIFRHAREFRSRKINRIATNEDILHNLLISSDPLISNLRPGSSQNSTHQPLFAETRTLLKVSNATEYQEDDMMMDVD